MRFHIDVAHPNDAISITQIHVTAFSSNAIIAAIHAFDTNLEHLRKTVHDKTVADIYDSKTTVLIARYMENDNADQCPGEIIAYAKWAHPVNQEDKYEWPKWNMPRITNWVVLRPWLAELHKVEKKIIGDTPRYELTYLAVDARFARQGVGTSLVQWGLDRCDQEGYVAYVESTNDAVPFYEKLGFKVAGRVVIDLGGLTGSPKLGVYDELGCIYEPKGGVRPRSTGGAVAIQRLQSNNE